MTNEGAPFGSGLVRSGKACLKMARPERFELPTAWFVARYSIQLSYGRVVCIIHHDKGKIKVKCFPI